MARLDRFDPAAGRRPGGAGYTVFVRLLKVLLPIAALVIVGVVFARLSQNPLQQIEAAATEEGKAPAPGQIEVTKAQYEGADDKGRPYTLIADKASRAPGTDDTVLFEGLKADIVLEDKSWLAVQSKAGVYAAKAQHLELSGGVSVYHDSGYEMHLDHLALDLGPRKAVSDAPVQAQGPLGEIRAQGLEVFDQGDRIVFAGPVTLTLYHLGERG